MKAFRVFAACALILSAIVLSQGAPILPPDGQVDKVMVGTRCDGFPLVSYFPVTVWYRVQYRTILWGGRHFVERAYMHFPKDGLPSCVSRAVLRLYFQGPRPAPAWLELYTARWTGSGIPEDDTLVRRFRVLGPGWRELDVTAVVREVIAGDREDLAFMVRLINDECPRNRSARAWFRDPELVVEPCLINVSVEGLEDFTLTQPWLAAHRYAPLGKLGVKVKADVPYEMRACYEVDPDLSFPADPMELKLESDAVWTTVPRCPTDYIVLPGFSGSPGEESHTYDVRIDLADLGDRASGEDFAFTIRVWAVPLGR